MNDYFILLLRSRRSLIITTAKLFQFFVVVDVVEAPAKTVTSFNILVYELFDQNMQYTS